MDDDFLKDAELVHPLIPSSKQAGARSLALTDYRVRQGKKSWAMQVMALPIMAVIAGGAPITATLQQKSPQTSTRSWLMFSHCI
jgi:hypothetical protein